MNWHLFNSRFQHLKLYISITAASISRSFPIASVFFNGFKQPWRLNPRGPLLSDRLCDTAPAVKWENWKKRLQVTYNLPEQRYIYFCLLIKKKNRSLFVVSHNLREMFLRQKKGSPSLIIDLHTFFYFLFFFYHFFQPDTSSNQNVLACFKNNSNYNIQASNNSLLSLLNEI